MIGVSRLRSEYIKINSKWYEESLVARNMRIQFQKLIYLFIGAADNLVSMFKNFFFAENPLISDLRIGLAFRTPTLSQCKDNVGMRYDFIVIKLNGRLARQPIITNHPINSRWLQLWNLPQF